MFSEPSVVTQCLAAFGLLCMALYLLAAVVLLTLVWRDRNKTNYQGESRGERLSHGRRVSDLLSSPTGLAAGRRGECFQGKGSLAVARDNSVIRDELTQIHLRAMQRKEREQADASRVCELMHVDPEDDSIQRDTCDGLVFHPQLYRPDNLLWYLEKSQKPDGLDSFNR